MALSTLLVFSLALYLISTTVYNLFFHPLAHIRGPLLARISILPSFFHACKGDRHIWIWQNFELYGDTFRAAPNLVLFNTPRAYADIYAARANLARSGFYRAWKRDKQDVNTINSTEPAVHAKKRRTLNLAFTERSLKAAGPFMAAHIDRWIELLSSDSEVNGGWSVPHNMSGQLDALVFDILGDLCFGTNFNTKEPGENNLKTLPNLIMKQVAIGYMMSKSGLLNLILYLQPRGLNKLQERIRHADVKQHAAFIESCVDSRIAAHKEGKEVVRQDMFHFLLSATDPETKLPAYTERNYLLAEARLLVLAGTDTSAATLCGLFFYIAHSPRILGKLTTEVRTTFESVQEIMLGSKLSKCQYLRACVDEALRISPPAPSELPREVPPGGALIQGQFYPVGTIVGCSAWSMGRDESVYGDATTYRPERWIPSAHPDTLNSEDEVRNLKKNFYPFSTGSSDCAGGTSPCSKCYSFAHGPYGKPILD
jgi:cytochrome P450